MQILNIILTIVTIVAIIGNAAMTYFAITAWFERRLMIAEIKKYNPDFDFQTIITEADRIYKERYPGRNK